MLLVSSSVLAEVAAAIAAHAPERGGALLGVPGALIVTDFVLDEDADTGSAIYYPSRRLEANVRTIEHERGLELKGIIHSHPGAYDRPSSQDENAIAAALAANPHLSDYVTPIVTNARHALRSELEFHELPVGRGKMSCYLTKRAANRRGVVPVAVLSISPIDLARIIGHEEEAVTQRGLQEARQVLSEHQRTVAAEIDLDRPPETFFTELFGVSFAAGRLCLRGGIELLLLAGSEYPAVPPLLLMTENGETEQLQVEWRIDLDAGERLRGAIRAIVRGRGPYRRGYGPPSGFVATLDKKVGDIARWCVQLSCEAPRPAPADTFSRTDGIVSDAIRLRRVLLVGAGSVGSYIAEQLVRTGVGHVTIVDHEIVEPPNLSRTAYAVEDLGVPKPLALARRLLRIWPHVSVDAVARDLLTLDPAEIDHFVRQSDVVVGATDSASAHRALNHFAYFREKPAVFVGIYRKAEGGEVIVSVPEVTPCYLCATLMRHAVQAQTLEVDEREDYGTGRVPGQIALGADIQHIASAAVKGIVALLLRDQRQAQLSSFLDSQIDSGASFLTMSTTASYWFYPHIFGETPGQGAYQSVWLKPTRRTECGVCGDRAQRSDPTALPIGGPSVHHVRERTSPR